MPVTLIAESVYARCLSALTSERSHASSVLGGPTPQFSGDKQEFINDLEQGKLPRLTLKGVLTRGSCLCLEDHLLLPGIHAYPRCASKAVGQPDLSAC